MNRQDRAGDKRQQYPAGEARNRLCVRYGMGLGMLLCLLADQETELVRLAEPVDELDTDLWILTHPALKGVARIKAFTDFLYDKLRASDKLFHASA